MDIEKPPPEKLLHLWNSVRGIVSTFHVGGSKLTEEHENRIRRHYNQLLSNLNVPDVVTQMFKSEKLSMKEHERLRKCYSTPIKASEELLNIVIVKPRDVYDSFIDVLKTTKQHHVLQMLTSDEENVGLDDQTMSEHSRIIRQNYDWLIEKLDVDSGLLTTLYSKDVLSRREYSQLFFEKDQFVKNETLLSIMSRKSVEEFNKFKDALNDTTQGYISEKLTKTPVADEQQPSSKPMVAKPIPEIDPSKRSRMKKQGNVARHKKRQSVEYLEREFKQIPTEFEIEISTKTLLIHQSSSTASRSSPISMISITKILEESRNIKVQTMLQAKNAEEKCERLMQEITGTKKQLGEIQETASDLKHRFDRAKDDNTNLLQSLKASESKVGSLTVLNQQKEKEADEKESMIKELKSQVTNYEIKLKESEALLLDTKDKLIESETDLKQVKPELEKAQQMLTETIAKKTEFEEKLTAAENRIDDLAVLNQRKEQEVNEKVRLVEMLQNQTTQSEEQLERMKEELLCKEEKFKIIELDFNSATEKLRETEEKLRESETILSDSEAKLKETEKDSDNFKSEDKHEKEKYLDLKQELELERKEKDYLKELNQKYKRRIDEVRREYKLDPILVQTIRTKAAEEKKSIFGLTILDNELFVVSEKSSEVEVYDSMKFNFIRRWDSKDLVDPRDVGSCKTLKCLYIFDFKRDGQSKEVIRFDPNGQLIKKWSIGKSYSLGLSVTDESTVLLAIYNESKLHEYSPDGQLIREINIKVPARILDPFHAIKLTNGQFVVSHGTGVDLHRVCIVDADGKLTGKKSFGEKLGSTVGKMNRPVYLSVDRNGFVMVADELNRRVLLLDSELKFKREILSREEKHGLRDPRRILLDESNNRLFVADNELNNQRILVFDC